MSNKSKTSTAGLSSSKMFVYFLIFVLVNYHNVDAAPILIDRADPTTTFPSRRTLFGIVLSCLSTTIICAWSSVHPNVPPPNRLKARWNRLRLMFWMITAPELVLAWAVRQLFAAREIRDIYNERYSSSDFPPWKRWQLIHGHLLEMGGFTLVGPDQRNVDPNEQIGTVLTFEYFKQNPQIDIPEIMVDEIEDRSKGDALSKIIAILQTTWFIVQCIARAQQGLALTELELITLALASLNAVTFGIWWHKPLGVQKPVKIYLRRGERQIEDAAPRQEPDTLDISFRHVIEMGWDRLKDLADVIPYVFSEKAWKDGPLTFLVVFFIGLPICLAYILTFFIFVLFPLGIIVLLRIIETKPVTQEVSRNQDRGLLAARIVAALQRFRYWMTDAVTDVVTTSLERILVGGIYGIYKWLAFLFGWFFLIPTLFVLLLLFVLFLVPFFTILFLVSFIFTAVFGIVTTTAIRPGASHVPSFYAHTTQSDRWSRMVVFALFGVIFGGLHCVGWNFTFPSPSEKTIWRSTSFAITVIPLVVAPIDFLIATRLRTRTIKSCGIFERMILLTLDLIMTILLFGYVPARLSLIAQAFALLRDQPPSALVAVDWIKYIPHLFSS